MFKIDSLNIMRTRTGPFPFSRFLWIGGLTIIALLGVSIATGIIGPSASAIIIGLCTLGIIILLQLDELVAVFVLVTHVYIDWYLGQAIVAQILTIFLLMIFFLTRSPQRPWERPRALWLWMTFLMLGIIPAIRGAFTRYDAAYYYPNIIFGAFLMFWLGTVIARDLDCMRRFFKILAAVGALLALMTTIQIWTGTLSFGTSRFNDDLANVDYFHLFGASNAYRVGSLFVNPDWNGAFFAMILCIPLSLFVQSTMLVEKALFLIEVLIIVPALLFTYSVGSWIAAGVAIIGFILLSGHIRYYIWIALFIVISALLLMFCFLEQFSLLYKHASDPSVFLLRNGAWETALRVMQAFPLTGTGFGFKAYMLRAEPYRVAEQFKMLAHPHNSYLEMGTMGGIPIMVVFVTLLLCCLRHALYNWLHADIQRRVLLSGGIAAIVALSVNSLSVNAWTLPPLAAFGWLILGILSSPLLLIQAKYSRGHVAVK